MEELLRQNRIDDGYYSHTSMFTPRGKFVITPSYREKFWKLYETDKYGLTENPQAYSMLRFDFDIKVKESDYKNERRFYSVKEVRFIINEINKSLKNVIDINDNAIVCCLLEKDIYLKQDKKVYSGGFHLQYPHIFVSVDVVTTIINQIKDKVKDQTGIDFDSGVYKNPWLMYGSKKDINLKPYLLTMIFNVDMNEMTMVDAFKNYSLYDTSEELIQITDENIESLLPRILSINANNRSTYEAIPNKVVAPQLKFIEKPKRTDNRDVEERLKEAEQLLNLLKASRVDDYHGWITIGWILYSISEGTENGLELWDNISKRSDNYDDCGCETQWSTMKVGKYTVGTLHKFAKEDSPLEYERLFKKKDDWVKNLIMTLSDTHCAEVFKEKNNGEVFYTKSNGWIIYNNQTRFWTLNNDKSSLTYIVSKFFSNIVKAYQVEYTKSYKPDVKDDSEFIKTLAKARIKVEMSKFAAGVITQLQGLLIEDDAIMTKFDSKPELFAFKCGNVYDIKTKETRRITKDDYIITHCGYTLPTRDEKSIEYIKSLIQTMCKDEDQLKTVLSMLSLVVYGNNSNELFFVLTGGGGNGKGLLDTFLQSSLGSYYKPVDMKQFTHYEKDANRANSEIASCQYARCVSASESETNKDNKLITSQIKKYSGNDTITTRYLCKDVFRFKPKFTMIMSCNDVPCLSTMDGGIERRMKIIELPFTFVTDMNKTLSFHEKYADISLKTKILNDESYRNAFLFILFDTWFENNGKFYENEEVKENTTTYFESQNPLKEWFNRYYEVDEKSKVRSSEMFAEIEYMGITSTQFGRYLKEICKSKRTKEGVQYMCKKRKQDIPEEGIEIM